MRIGGHTGITMHGTGKNDRNITTVHGVMEGGRLITIHRTIKGRRMITTGCEEE